MSALRPLYVLLRALFHGLSSRRLPFDSKPISVGFVVDLLALRLLSEYSVFFTASINRGVAAVLGVYIKLRGPHIEVDNESIAKYFLYPMNLNYPSRYLQYIREKSDPLE